MMKPIKAIIHCSDTEDSGTVSWSAIRKWHTGAHPQSPHKWADIGYHYGVELIGDYYEVLVGRAENVQGAHCYGYNANSLGICFVGKFDKEPPADRMLMRAVEVFTPIVNRLMISYDEIKPHSFYEPGKSCPGKAFPMDRFIRSLKLGRWI